MAGDMLLPSMSLSADPAQRLLGPGAEQRAQHVVLGLHGFQVGGEAVEAHALADQIICQLGAAELRTARRFPAHCHVDAARARLRGLHHGLPLEAGRGQVGDVVGLAVQPLLGGAQAAQAGRWAW